MAKTKDFAKTSRRAAKFMQQQTEEDVVFGGISGQKETEEPTVEADNAETVSAINGPELSDVEEPAPDAETENAAAESIEEEGGAAQPAEEGSAIDRDCASRPESDDEAGAEKEEGPSKCARTRQLNVLVDEDLFYDLKAYVARRDTQWGNLSAMVRDVMHDYLKSREA